MIEETIIIKKLVEIESKDENDLIHKFFDVQIESYPVKAKGFWRTQLIILKNFEGWDFKEGDKIELEDSGGNYLTYKYKDKFRSCQKFITEGQ